MFLPIWEPKDLCETGDAGGSRAVAASGHQEAEAVEVSVQTISGELLTVLTASLRDTVYEVKQQLASFANTTVGQQQLVYGRSVLQDSQTLADSGITGPEVVVQCVRIRPSGIAQYLEEKRLSDDPAEALSGSLADVADSVMQAEHRLSEQRRPQAADLQKAMTPQRRAELISWMHQAFDALHFDDMLLHNTVLTLDRYYTKRKTPIKDNALQRVLLAAVCTEMKLSTVQEFPPGHWQRVLQHLCQGRVGLRSILLTESEVLSTLDYVVGVPTSLAFLRGLTLRLGDTERDAEASRYVAFASFLLELALLDAELQCGYPAVVLAGAAMSAALRAYDACFSEREMLKEDLLAYAPGLWNLDQLVQDCEQDLLMLWSDCANASSPWASFYHPLQAKYSRQSKHSVALMSPKKSLERFAKAQQAANDSSMPVRCNTPPIPAELAPAQEDDDDESSESSLASSSSSSVVACGVSSDVPVFWKEEEECEAVSPGSEGGELGRVLRARKLM